MRVNLRDSIDVEVPAAHLWDIVTDWSRHGEWIPFTRVRVVGADPHRVGARLEAWTGVGPVGILDPMVVTHWSAPADGRRVCEVLHTGRVVRGEGGFEVEPLGVASARFVWWESVALPLGPAGAAGWRMLAPVWQRETARALGRLRELALARA